MSQGAKVQAIRALEDLKGALSRFSGEGQIALVTAEQFIQRTEEWLEERENYWRHPVQRGQESVRRAEAALGGCEKSGRYDDKGNYHEPDCSSYENSLRLAENRLEEAEDELRNVRRWMKVISEAVSVYRGEAHRLGQILVNDVPRADAVLGRKVADLLAYVAIAGPSGEAVADFGNGGDRAEAGEWNVAGSSEEVQKLRDGLMGLQGSSFGSASAAAIRGRGTRARFGQTGDDLNAYYDPGKNEIVINESFRSSSPTVVTAILAHEGTHVLWDERGSIEQEMDAFKAQAAVWNELKGNESNIECDEVSWILSLPGEDAKDIIRRGYPDLPESA